MAKKKTVAKKAAPKAAAKPASVKVKVRPLKKLKDAAA
jgi:hypothetical protein